MRFRPRQVLRAPLYGRGMRVEEHWFNVEHTVALVDGLTAAHMLRALARRKLKTCQELPGGGDPIPFPVKPKRTTRQLPGANSRITA